MDTQPQYILVNSNEEIVKVLARELIDKTDMCRCDKCYMDVCAIALNGIAGSYVTSKGGNVIIKAMKSAVDNKTEYLVAVTRAIELVKESPKHGMDADPDPDTNTDPDTENS